MIEEPLEGIAREEDLWYRGEGSRTLEEPMDSSAHVGAVIVVYPIKDAFAFIHGPVGCKFLPEFSLAWHMDEMVQIGCTYMNEYDVIYGATEKLRKGIIKTYHDRHPRLLAIIGTDASAVIGDNVDLVIQDVQPETPDMRIIFLDTAGFRGDYFSGISEGMGKLVSHVVAEPEVKRAGTINLLGEFSGGPDQAELRSLLAAAGIQVNAIFTGGSTFDELAGAARAEYNVLLSPESGHAAAVGMEQRFGIPYFGEQLPIGVEATREWALEIGRRLGREREVAAGIAELYSRAKKGVEELKPRLAGKRFGVVAPSDRALALTRFAIEELEMEPVMVAMTNAHRPSYLKVKALLKEKGLPAEVLPRSQYYDVEEILATTPVDLLLASEFERHAAYPHGVHLVPVSYPMMLGSIHYGPKIYKGAPGKAPTLGFGGALELTSRMVREYESPTVPLPVGH